jgi:hypothetical protein
MMFRGKGQYQYTVSQIKHYKKWVQGGGPPGYVGLLGLVLYHQFIIIMPMSSRSCVCF